MSAMRLRIAYTKIEDARYIAHLDLTRVFERAIRRAGIHMSYSEGFNPRPKISFGFALAVGTEGEREYVDVELRDDADIGEVLARLQEQLPPGIRLLQGRALDQGAKSLMAVLNAASYRIRIPMALPIQAERLEEAVKAWLKRDHVTYSRYSKRGPTDKDIRPWVKQLEGKIQGDNVIFDLEVEMGNSGSVRPEEVLASLRELENLPIDIEGLHVIRTGVHVSYEGGKRSPLEMA
ncbi:radical SAM-linked protein [Desulfosporosinus orientis DSM 765]|uniref:Radical SAM-linked protein n=1 Tax=Desulfosporosinus orientis (strain ATCC 19365 / DSM 765 / NCIMB 8382 / VKM B-1628 / Singapore I) TaxID=768706 RepID=G7W778_DESOD|nr:TIGR03936 family radical SAM-associated protein [Desulfosporosinus orientis]AET70586.1 radical SAM-linked protein [Desulfosporosinus orientis DSM 765]